MPPASIFNASLRSGESSPSVMRSVSHCRVAKLPGMFVHNGPTWRQCRVIFVFFYDLARIIFIKYQNIVACTSRILSDVMQCSFCVKMSLLGWEYLYQKGKEKHMHGLLFKINSTTKTETMTSLVDEGSKV